jgi:hypothetical protein
MPDTSKVAIKVALRPIRSPQWPNIAAPIGRPTNPIKKMPNAWRTPTKGLHFPHQHGNGGPLAAEA